MKVLHGVSKSFCALCLVDRPLKESHIVPAFVVRHLTETSATGFLTQPGSQKRIQDGPKEALLCEDCEQRFGRWERTFSIEAFPKIQSEEFDCFEYDQWLLKLAVSLAWRALVTDSEEVIAANPKWRSAIEATLENWRSYLLDRIKKPLGSHHLFIVPGIPNQVPSNAHPKTLHYLLRACDAAVGVGSSLAVCVKLIRSIFYSPILPSDPSGWHGTRIHAGPGKIISAKQSIKSKDFSIHLDAVAALMSEPLSPKVVQQIVKSVSKNPNRLLTSETLQINLATKNLWDM